MSSATALARRVVARPLPDAVRPAVLRLVPAARTGAPRAPFVTLVVLVLAAGLLGLLALNTLLAQDAFRLHRLSGQTKALTDQEQALRRDVEDARTPRALASRAAALGMVPAGPPAFLRLPDGTVLGAEVPAGASGAPGAAAAAPAAPAPAPAVAPDAGDPEPDATAPDTARASGAAGAAGTAAPQPTPTPRR